MSQATQDTQDSIIQEIANREKIHRRTVYKNLTSGLRKLEQAGLALDFARVVYLTHAQRNAQKEAIAERGYSCLR